MSICKNSNAAALPEIDVRPVVGDDTVTTARRELKYALKDADPHSVAALLESALRPIRFGNERSSRVSSLYFDDHRLSSVCENLDGVGRRHKLRLRWYQTGLPQQEAYYEVKRRYHGVIGKQRFRVSTSGSLAQISLPKLSDALMKQLPLPQAEALARRPEPVVLVSYRRLHFRHREHGNPIRLTIDYDIQAFTQLGQRYLRRYGSERPLREVILEVKVPPGYERQVPSLLHPLRPRLSRYSKYVSCVFASGLRRGEYL